ncbi:MAG TPA: metal-dependent hydrolase [Patescibacteria group bacterium]|nr:metal-dependent hydrolase [Patescibacteria group bacterium]
MTGRTHDLAAFTAINYIVATSSLPHLSLATIIVAFAANMIGGLAPDIDQPTGDLWHKLPAGTVYSRLFTPFLGGHRHLSHSILGIVIFGFLAKFLLQLSEHTLLVNDTIVWWSFMIGFLSHLVTDTFTREGVPWLFPIPYKFGIPPFAFLRFKTGGFVENLIVFPGLIVLNGYMFYLHYTTFLGLFHKLQ